MVEKKDLTSEIDESLNLLFQLVEKTSEKKNLLDQGRNVYLQVGLFKIPYVRRPKRKFLKLCHSLYGDDPDICLFVPNRKTGIEYKQTTDEFIDFCVDYYSAFLEKHKIKGINTIMPVKQLKAEYGTYELRRKLVQRFDLFLCKNSLLFNPRFLSGLGKIFSNANKNPVGVSFPNETAEYDPEFQKSIDRAVNASYFYIKPFSDNYTIPVGTLNNTKQQLKENIQSVIHQILTQDYIPGGFSNIKVIYLWPSQSKAIPLYVCSDVPKTIVFSRSKTKKSDRKNKFAQGELSTLPGKKVTVTRNGEVFVTSLEEKDEVGKKFDDEDDESFDDGSEEEEEEENHSENEKSKDKNKKKRGVAEGKSESESEDEDDEKIEETEERLLQKNRESGYNSFDIPKTKRNKQKRGREEDESGSVEEGEEDDEEEEEEEEEEEFVAKKKMKLEKKKKKKGNKGERKDKMKRNANK